MAGLNIWGICTFVMPIVLVIIIGLIMMIVSIVERLDKLIKKLGGTHGKIKRKTSSSY